MGLVFVVLLLPGWSINRYSSKFCQKKKKEYSLINIFSQKYIKQKPREPLKSHTVSSLKITVAI